MCLIFICAGKHCQEIYLFKKNEINSMYKFVLKQQRKADTNNVTLSM